MILKTRIKLVLNNFMKFKNKNYLILEIYRIKKLINNKSISKHINP